MERKDNTLAWVSYLTIIGWIIAIVLFVNEQRENTLVRYHLRQSLGIFLLSVIYGICTPLFVFIPILGWIILWLMPVFIFVLWIVGLINAIQGAERPVPLLGNFFEDKLTFID